MVRRALLILFASLILTGAARANYFPKFSTNWVTVGVGETVTIQVTSQWSGLVDYGFQPWKFVSDNPAVAIVTGGLQQVRTVEDVKITGVSPGNARVRWWSPDGIAYVEIVVGEQTPPRIAASATRVGIGKPVTLTALYPGYAGYDWYLGRMGDRSHPIGTNSRELTYTPPTYGTYYVWVAVNTPFQLGMAEQSIEVVHPRRRAARH